MIPGAATSACASRLLSTSTFVGEGSFGKRAMKSPMRLAIYTIARKLLQQRRPSQLSDHSNSPQTRPRRDELLVRGTQSILAKFMKDSVVRGRLLQLLYERRSEGSIPFGHGEQAVPPPGGISRRDWLRAVAQLSEYRLIDWTPLDESRRTTILPQQQAPTATSTPQQQVITEALEKLITAINQADVSEQEKNKAKSLLRKLLGSKAAASVLGAGARSLAAKYFSG